VTKICHFWFNTGFVDDLVLNLPKSVIDVANKDKKCKIFKKDFTLTVQFRNFDPKFDKDEDKYSNWLKFSLAKQKVPKLEKDDDDDGAIDTDSSIELKAEEDVVEEKKKVVEDVVDEKKKSLVEEKQLKKEKKKELKQEKEEKFENGRSDEENGRKKSPSYYKYEGYNLPINVSESDEESVDVSINDPNNDEFLNQNSPVQSSSPSSMDNNLNMK